MKGIYNSQCYFFRVNCSFYFKIGACRHGDRCSRLHNKPTFSQGPVVRKAISANPGLASIVFLRFNPGLALIAFRTTGPSTVRFPLKQKRLSIMMVYIYCMINNMALVMLGSTISDVEAQEHYDKFFKDVFLELEEKYGEIEEMNVCDNLGDHLVGNVYVKYRYEEDAEKSVEDLNNRWYNGQPIYAELSPVTDFREACCRQYEMGECTRGGFCNFMHLRPISKDVR
ncbi:hypothetical protein QZH41_012050 [Actinostola sp. cb2023]|nr:hypothetical protein QZH41_012050 [Actinostola sp. cb2023]